MKWINPTFSTTANKLTPPKCKRLSGTGIGKCSLVTQFKICNLLYNLLLKIVNTVRSQMLQANAVTHENLYNNNQLPHYNYYYTMKEHVSITTTIQTWIQRKPNLITFFIIGISTLYTFCTDSPSSVNSGKMHHFLIHPSIVIYERCPALFWAVHLSKETALQ